MNDEAKPAAETAPSGAPPGTMPIPAAVAEAETHRDKKPEPDARGADIDWGSLAPRTLGEVTMDVIKLVVFSLAIMNVWALAHHVGVTRNMAIAGAVAGLAATLGWKAYLAVAGAFGTRVVGATYAVLGVAACAAILWYAANGEAASSKQLKMVVQVLGLACLYPAALGVFAAVKGEDPAALNALGLPMNLRWFSTLWVLFAKEVRTFFTTAVPYIIMFVFTAMNGLLVLLLLRYYLRPGMQDLPKPGEILPSNIFTLLALWIVWAAIPMRLVAEEKAMGTIETLLTVPVTDVQVIFAKFLAAMAFYAVNLVPFLGYHVVFAIYARDFDWGPVFAEFLGLVLWGGMAMAIGLFFSTLTSSQLVALILGFATNVLLYLERAIEGFVKDDTTIFWGLIHVKTLAHYLSVNDHYMQLCKGVVSTQSLVFFLSTTALALFASVRGLEAQRWK